MKPIRLVCGTRASYDDFPQKTALGRSLSLFRHASPPQLMLFDNNRAGLSSIYNYAIEQSRNDPAILVFLHDDLHLCDFYWMDRIRDAVTQFDIVGLAGNTRRLPGQPSWFFRDASFTRDDAQYLSGVVGHGSGFPCTNMSIYGPPGRECKLLDGLLLAADSERLIASGLTFDERFDFHFYDLDFCRRGRVARTAHGNVADERRARKRRIVRQPRMARRLRALHAEVHGRVSASPSAPLQGPRCKRLPITNLSRAATSRWTGRRTRRRRLRPHSMPPPRCTPRSRIIRRAA